MVVLDASAAVALLADHPQGRAAAVRNRLLGEDEIHVPHLLDLEVANALRRLVLHDELTEERALAALTDLVYLAPTRHPHYPLLPRAWQLQANLTAYDAVYVALAETIRAPLLTFDPAMRDAPGHSAVVEVL